MASSRSAYQIRNDSLEKIQAIQNIFRVNEPPLTVRQVYYALTDLGVVPKTEQGYRAVVYQLKNMRLDGSIPYSWIADNTRWQIKPDTDHDLYPALRRMQRFYRRDFWTTQPVYVEIWVEKDALVGVVSPISEEFDVPLYVSRGYSSMTALYNAAEQIKRVGKPAFIYHFGDFDPSGVDAAYKIRDELIKHGAEITFKRAAIIPEQIEKYRLPSRPTKKNDPRARKWGDQVRVELDALPAPILRDLVRQAIEQHIDPVEWERMRMIEQAERRALTDFNDNFDLAPDFLGY